MQHLAHNVTAKVISGEISSEAGKSFCDEILAELASNMRKLCTFLHCDWNAGCLREGDGSKALSWGSASGSGTVFTGEKFAALVGTCETVQSTGPVDQMLAILTDISRKPNKRAFSDFLLPTLEHLPPQGVIDNLKPYKDLFRNVISSYTHQFVPEHARRIQDWSSPRKGCSSAGCKDCKDLDRFLTSVEQSGTRFAVATARRNHLEKKLMAAGVLMSTDAKGSPYKLVVKKTRSIWRDDVESLQKTRQSATDEIFRIGKEKLRSMLGEDEYAKLHTSLGISCTSRPGSDESASARAPLSDVPTNKANTQEKNVPTIKPSMKNPVCLNGQRVGQKSSISKLQIETICHASKPSNSNSFTMS